MYIMKKIECFEDIKLSDLDSILADLEYYPEDFYPEEVFILKIGIQTIKSAILRIEKDKKEGFYRADEITIQIRLIKFTKKIYKSYDDLRKKYFDMSR